MVVWSETSGASIWPPSARSVAAAINDDRVHFDDDGAHAHVHLLVKRCTGDFQRLAEIKSALCTAVRDSVRRILDRHKRGIAGENAVMDKDHVSNASERCQ